MAGSWNGNIDALASGYTLLKSVLTDLPGHEKMTETALNFFFNGLSAATACDTVTITDWLRQRRPDHTILDSSADVVARIAPEALVDCGDELMSGQDWQTAQQRYQQLLNQYPQDQLASRAQQGLTKATLAIQLANVRPLLPAATASQPAYCSSPAPYGGAPAYTKGATNPALIYGSDDYTNRLPGAWRASDPTNAVLVICAGTEQYGASVQTCAYNGKIAPSFTPVNVTFHQISFPVKVYELRTGALVADTTVIIGGASCPDTVQYTGFGIDVGPPPDMYVIPADSDVSAGFAPLITP